MTYKTKGTCSVAINFDVIDGKVHNVQFVGGCPGNTSGVARLAEGRTVDELINMLSGIPCRAGTSCPDQLAKALTDYKNGKLK